MNINRFQHGIIEMVLVLECKIFVLVLVSKESLSLDLTLKLVEVLVLVCIEENIKGLFVFVLKKVLMVHYVSLTHLIFQLPLNKTNGRTSLNAFNKVTAQLHTLSVCRNFTATMTTMFVDTLDVVLSVIAISTNQQ